MRSRWAAAVVLLASVLLLTLCAPAPAADRPAPAPPVAQQDQPAQDRHDEAAEAVPETAGTPSPGEGDASFHQPVARPPRASGAAGTAGTAHPAAGTASTATAQRRSVPGPYPVGPPRGRGPADPAPVTACLQTFRC
ncbi:hypothetical protein ACH5A7_16700 [Streptomyces sp. NPDC018955]|uniref:hypothetical protein n=1 Tax=Streptomyces sp. NPDC018955 TaxID=3365055 RepID=UPI0037A6EDA7